MLLLAIASYRVHQDVPHLARLILDGHWPGAVRLGRDLFHAAPTLQNQRSRASAAQLLGRALLAGGSEVEAEDTFRSALRSYAGVSRAHVRWLGGLDQATMAMHLNKPALAAQAYCAVADDPAADASLRIEAMAGAAVSWHMLGDVRSAEASLEAAGDLASSLGLSALAELVEALRLELIAICIVRTEPQLGDHALSALYGEAGLADRDRKHVSSKLGLLAGRGACADEIASRRLRYIAAALEGDEPSRHSAEWLQWLQTGGIRGLIPSARVEAAVLQLGHRMSHSIGETLGPDSDENAVHGHRFQLDLCYVHARLALNQGRTNDALRLYARHAVEAVLLTNGVARRSCSTGFLCTAKQLASFAEDSDCARLPLRYRRAYTFVVDNLEDEELSVSQVAQTLGVTERALQMVFRKYLGTTPAELIRRKRAERVHAALTLQPGQNDLAELAARYGLGNRAALSSGYRARFSVNPTATLRGHTTTA